MRVLACSVSPDAQPSFEALQAYSWVSFVGMVRTAEELLEVVQREQIDVCVTGVLWLDEWCRAKRMADDAGVVLPPWAVAGYYVTGALCLDCSVLPVADLIDLREGTDSAADRLLLVAKGFTAKSEHEIVPSRWTHNRDYVRQAIRDEFDLRIMRRLLCGETNTEIARHVHLSYQTVNNRISQMIHRTGSSNRTRLATMFHDPYTFGCTYSDMKTQEHIL